MPEQQDVRRIAPAKCLECGHTIDAIGSLGGDYPRPNPGDAIACIRCGAVMTMEDGALRGFTEKEMDELVADKEWMNDLARTVKRIHLLKHAQS